MKVSRASAAQRAGRAGRTGPGRALRLYGKHDHDARPEHHAPEIERLDLAGTVLELRAAGIDPADLPWVDPPPAPALGAANTLLRRLGCVESGAITEMGRACARFPLHPRLSRLVLEAARRGYGPEGCTIAARLSENEARVSDVHELLDLPRGGRAEQARAQLLRSLPPNGPRQGTRDEAISISVLAGFPDRVARRRGDEVLLASGGAAEIGKDAPQSELLVAVDAEERRERGRSRTLVRLACAIEPEWLLGSVREETELRWEPARERVEAVHRLLYDQLVLEESRSAPQEAAAAAEILFQHASFDRGRIEELRARAAAAGMRVPTDAEVDQALRKACEGFASLEELRHLDLAAALFDAAERAALDRLAPEQVALPSGRKLRVEYAPGQPPAVRSRLQDFFGMARGPAIQGGRLPLVLHLLAPNGRAQQVTQDLAGFWERHYPAVRKELMRKYPRHAWPEDGARAAPPAARK
jgi:ATP-dependent helicase HrpB